MIFTMKKMKFEIQHTKLQNKIKTEKNTERKTALRKQMQTLKK